MWPLLTFAMVALWVFGILDIDRHRRRGTSTGAGLLLMAGCVSLVTIVAVAGVSATFASQWVETVSEVGSDSFRAGELEDGDQARSYIFSFGVENASYASPIEPTGTDEHRDSAPR